MDKCKKCFKTAIKACDGFGTFITFRINEDIEYKSLIGGCSTILFVIITVVYASYCCSSFFAKKMSTLSSQIKSFNLILLLI